MPCRRCYYTASKAPLFTLLHIDAGGCGMIMINQNITRIQHGSSGSYDEEEGEAYAAGSYDEGEI